MRLSVLILNIESGASFISSTYLAVKAYGQTSFFRGKCFVRDLQLFIYAVEYELICGGNGQMSAALNTYW